MCASAGPGSKELYEFGPFRVDPEKEILLRAGEPVPLTPKTFQILLVLIRHNKEVVTKDDLMKSVWPDTFVEEANLSRNIFMLRKALGDSGQDKYIVTVPGRGYRLAEDVHLVAERELSVVAATHTKMQVRIEETKPWGKISVAAIVLIAAAVSGLWFFRHRPPVLTEKDSVVIADFANSTGDPVFDGTLRQGLAVQLEQSPYLNLISEGRIRRTLKMMGKGADERITGETARELCERTGGAAVLEGSIAALGAKYVVGLRATNCHNGDVIDDEQVQAEKKEDVLDALSTIASKFRTHVGESLTTITQHDKPLDEATTTSLEALRAYSAAVRTAFATGYSEAIPLMKSATTIDPNFALAHAHLGLWYSSIGESQLATESTIKAFELRERTSDREKLFITAMYYRDVTGNVEKGRQTLESWARTYPRDPIANGLLSGFCGQGTGKYEESIEAGKKVLEVDPDFTPAHVNIAFSQFYLGQLNEAEAALNRASDRKLDIPELLVLRYHIASLNRDSAEMDRAAALAKGKSGAEDWMIHAQSLVAARSGKLDEAGKLSRSAMGLAQQTGQKERAATYVASTAVWESFFGNADAAERSATEALKLSTGRDVEYSAAFALAQAGDFSQAQSLANDLNKHFPEDTSVQFSYLPTLRGLFALHQKDSSKALEQLEIAIPNETGQTGISFFAFFGNLYPAYVRGESYLAANNAPAAIAEFQKILKYRGLVISDPMGAMAQLQLARAYVLGGDKANATLAYQRVLELWKDSDADLPAVKQAREEYRRLGT
jgi:DNA-binding winged helix-turn-helix (wHTH) protein/tetratricopeptide (TPR) repeat protein